MYQPPQDPNQLPYQQFPNGQPYPQQPGFLLPQYPLPLQMNTNGATMMREFALVDGVGVRHIQLYQKEQGESIIIMLDGATIGSIASIEEFTQGKKIELLDGSQLKVQLVKNQVQVFRNGQELPTVKPPQVQPPSSPAQPLPIPPGYSLPGYPLQGMAPFPAPSMYPMYNGIPVITPLPRKKKTGLWITLGVLGGVLLLSCVICGAFTLGSSSNTNKSALSTQDNSVSTNTHYHTGDVVAVGNIWQVTVTHINADATDRYILVAVTLKNTSSQEQRVSSLLDFNLRSTDGQKYDEIITSDVTAPDGKVEAGEVMKGTLTFSEPLMNQRNFIFSFEDNVFESGQVEWDLSL